MAQHKRPLVAGNWKMNGLAASGAELAEIVRRSGEVVAKADLLVCPPATLLAAFSKACAGSVVRIGGQDCRAESFGAFTGDISAEMLADAGASFVIVGHSERRTLHGESSADVSAKAKAALRAGLVPIVCVGESEAQRRSGQTLSIIEEQMRDSLAFADNASEFVIAYEPIWAIGTGLTPTAADVAEVHQFMRQQLANRVADAASIRLLYGGSVKPSNARELMAVENVDGALVGGASLKADDFMGIAAAIG